jgi:hypothetical protein
MAIGTIKNEKIPDNVLLTVKGIPAEISVSVHETRSG